MRKSVRILIVMAGVVTVCDVLALGEWAFEYRLKSVTGAQTDHPGCTGCSMVTHEIGECAHSGPNHATMVCFTTQCIHNYLSWWKCSTFTASGPTNCWTTNDALFVYRQQILRSGTFTCTTTQPYTAVPEAAVVACSGARGERGRCFTTPVCKTQTVLQNWVFTGAHRCSP